MRTRRRATSRGDERAHPPPGQLAGQAIRRHAPDLADVGVVERAGHGGPEPGRHDVGEGVTPGPAERGGDGVEGGAGRDPGREPGQQPGRAEGEREPPAGQADPAVPRPLLEVVAEELAQRRRGRGAASRGAAGGCRGRPAARRRWCWPTCPRRGPTPRPGSRRGRRGPPATRWPGRPGRRRGPRSPSRVHGRQVRRHRLRRHLGQATVGVAEWRTTTAWSRWNTGAALSRTRSTPSPPTASPTSTTYTVSWP